MEWIKVTEDLPPKHKQVLVKYKNDTELDLAYLTIYDTWAREYYPDEKKEENFYCHSLPTPTHWMERPELPEE